MRHKIPAGRGDKKRVLANQSQAVRTVNYRDEFMFTHSLLDFFL